jgi:hypothetical protein
MKLGAENRTKTLLAIGLLAVALWSLVHMLTRSEPTSAASSAPGPGLGQPASTARRATTARRTNATGKKTAGAILPNSLDPRLHLALLRESEGTTYAGTGRNIFQEQAAPLPIPTHRVIADKGPTPPPPPPVYTPPPIDLKFYGFASQQGEAKRIFLTKGENVFVAKEGDIVDRRYRVLHIAPTYVDIEDILNSNRQSIPLTQG